MPTLMNISSQLVELIDESVKEKKCLNFREICSRYMCEIIGQVAFGLECNLQTVAPFKHTETNRVTFF